MSQSSLNPKLVNTRRREPELFVHFPRKSGSELLQGREATGHHTPILCVFGTGLIMDRCRKKIGSARNFDWIDHRRGSLKTC